LLDPKLIKFQFQVSTISRGYDAEYFTKYPAGLFPCTFKAGPQKLRKSYLSARALDCKDLHRRQDRRHKNYFVEMNLPMMKDSVPFRKFAGLRRRQPLP
jgi:hypothetical protein